MNIQSENKPYKQRQAMKVAHTLEPQYQNCIDLRNRQGLTTLGLMSNQVWHDDPRRLTFLLSRYKFVAKMLSGLEHVLEIGCADAFGTRVVLQEVKKVTAIDFDPAFVEDVKSRMEADWEIDVRLHDILVEPVGELFDGAYALDVLEHIPRESEQRFLANIAASLTHCGVLIIGTPSVESQNYASAPSKAGHKNCKDYFSLKNLLSSFFYNVFVFSMNDEVIHTGFYPMASYLIALCCYKQKTC